MTGSFPRPDDEDQEVKVISERVKSKRGNGHPETKNSGRWSRLEAGAGYGVCFVSGRGNIEKPIASWGELLV